MTRTIKAQRNEVFGEKVHGKSPGVKKKAFVRIGELG
jgi:hypothetical protein